MTARDFAYWLQGFFELADAGDTIASGPIGLTPKQTDLVKRHLALVFVHDIDPKAGPPDTQKLLQEIHDAAAAQGPLPPRIGGDGPGGIKYRC